MPQARANWWAGRALTDEDDGVWEAAVSFWKGGRGGDCEVGWDKGVRTTLPSWGLPSGTQGVGAEVPPLGGGLGSREI